MSVRRRLTWRYGSRQTSEGCCCYPHSPGTLEPARGPDAYIPRQALFDMQVPGFRRVPDIGRSALCMKLSSSPCSTDRGGLTDTVQKTFTQLKHTCTASESESKRFICRHQTQYSGSILHRRGLQHARLFHHGFSGLQHHHWSAL